jgi:hypothetical protein
MPFDQVDTPPECPKCGEFECEHTEAEEIAREEHEEQRSMDRYYANKYGREE